MLFGKKKKRIAFLLGCLWYYIKRMEDVNRFSESTDIMTTVCVELGIDWEQVNNAEKAYVRWWRGGVEDRPGMEEGKHEDYT